VIWPLVAAALLVSLPLAAQEPGSAPKKKKAAAPKAAHQQASKDQIRKFNDLQKKKQQPK